MRQLIRGRETLFALTPCVSRGEKRSKNGNPPSFKTSNSQTAQQPLPHPVSASFINNKVLADQEQFSRAVGVVLLLWCRSCTTMRKKLTTPRAASSPNVRALGQQAGTQLQFNKPYLLPDCLIDTVPRVANVVYLGFKIAATGKAEIWHARSPPDT